MPSERAGGIEKLGLCYGTNPQALPQSIVKVNWWMNHESGLCNLKINTRIVEDDRIESYMENIHEESPSIECMVHENHSPQSCGSDFSCDSPPSLCDVAPRCRSPASECNGANC